uniref:Uncharacterized protein n=1 Tax=Arundo donax TaxID=35708 RepID=A0A0A9QJS1_ARUDO
MYIKSSMRKPCRAETCSPLLFTSFDFRA